MRGEIGNHLCGDAEDQAVGLAGRILIGCGRAFLGAGDRERVAGNVRHAYDFDIRVGGRVRVVGRILPDDVERRGGQFPACDVVGGQPRPIPMCAGIVRDSPQAPVGAEDRGAGRCPFLKTEG